MRSHATNTLHALLTELRQAWQERKDTSLVHQLAREHPDLAGNLYDYVAILVDFDIDEQAPDTQERAQFADQVRGWFDEGRRVAIEDFGAFPIPIGTSSNSLSDVSSDDPPMPLIRLIRERSGLKASDAARQMGITSAFISKANQFANEMRNWWGQEFADRFYRVLGIPQDETLNSYFNGYRNEHLVASRRTQLDTHVPTPEKVLEMGGITDAKERAFWLRPSATDKI